MAEASPRVLEIFAVRRTVNFPLSHDKPEGKGRDEVERTLSRFLALLVISLFRRSRHANL